MMTPMKCYIEEYENEGRQPSARLRQNGTGKKVDLGFANANDYHNFVRFLSAAKKNQALMPSVFSKENAENCVVVSGELDFDAPDEIRFVPNEGLQYVFS